ESGAIEQDADVVGLLYQANPPDDENQEQSAPSEGMIVNLAIAKQRNGPTGDVSLIFLKQYTRFESLSKEKLEDVPVNIKNE
ncbi:MAG: DnaB-like helicase C-terminal domain-containing protein, partial [Limisphaerales bacterium]